MVITFTTTLSPLPPPRSAVGDSLLPSCTALTRDKRHPNPRPDRGPAVVAHTVQVSSIVSHTLGGDGSRLGIEYRLGRMAEVGDELGIACGAGELTAGYHSPLGSIEPSLEPTGWWDGRRDSRARNWTYSGGAIQKGRYITDGTRRCLQLPLSHVSTDRIPTQLGEDLSADKDTPRYERRI